MVVAVALVMVVSVGIGGFCCIGGVGVIAIVVIMMVVGGEVGAAVALATGLPCFAELYSYRAKFLRRDLPQCARIG